MTARIAFVGWGSLVWSPRSLPHCGPWTPTGPTLPIEFSRISRDGRLTLIIDTDHGDPVPTWCAPAAAAPDIASAVGDLALREGCPENRIGQVRVDGGLSDDHGATEVIAKWCRMGGWDGAVWTDLISTFHDRTGTPYSVDAAIGYLDGLTGDTRDRAIEYLERAPVTTDTPLRRVWRTRRMDPGGQASPTF